MLGGGEPAGSEPDLSRPCFSEVMRIWDGVSEYMLQQFALNKVRFSSCSSWYPDACSSLGSPLPRRGGSLAVL